MKRRITTQKPVVKLRKTTHEGDESDNTDDEFYETNDDDRSVRADRNILG